MSKFFGGRSDSESSSESESSSDEEIQVRTSHVYVMTYFHKPLSSGSPKKTTKDQSGRIPLLR